MEALHGYFEFSRKSAPLSQWLAATASPLIFERPDWRLFIDART
jgi:hypothetical protein